MVHDSQAYRRMGVTRECISRILELREKFLSFQTLPTLPTEKILNCYFNYFPSNNLGGFHSKIWFINLELGNFSPTQVIF